MKKFSESKYSNPSELVQFSTELQNAVTALAAKHGITSAKSRQGKIGIELWPLVSHTTHGAYYEFTSKALSKQIEFWAGLDCADEGLALIIWFENLDTAPILALINNPSKQHYEEFGRYRRRYLNQFWVELKDSELDALMNTPANAQKIIENFLDEVLSVL
jgi:hypothetical protein